MKHENHLPTGAFKVRGGVNLMAKMGPEERATPVIAASTGNHGQSVAHAAHLFGITAIICVPEDANAVKLVAMERSGAEIVMHGRRFRRRPGALREARGGKRIPLHPFRETSPT